MDRFKLIVSVYLMLVKKDNINLLKRFNTGYKDGWYGLPSGHLENKESVTLGLCREVREETGIIIKPKDADLVHVMHRQEKDIRLDLFFTVKKYLGNPINTEPGKCDDLNWFPIKKLPSNTIPYISSAINSYLHKSFYSETGW